MGTPITYWYYFDRYRLSIGERVLYENQIVKLSTTQFETLRVLIESGGKRLDKSDMADTVCPTAADGPNTIERAVSDLRDKLRDPVGESRIIRRVEGGYRFAAEVRKVQHVDFEGVSEGHSHEMIAAEGELTSKKDSVAESVEPANAEYSVPQRVTQEDLKGSVITFSELWRTASPLVRWVICLGVVFTASLAVMGVIKDWQRIKLVVSIPQLFMLLAAIFLPTRGPRDGRQLELPGDDN